MSEHITVERYEQPRPDRWGCDALLSYAEVVSR